MDLTIYIVFSVFITNKLFLIDYSIKNLLIVTSNVDYSQRQQRIHGIQEDSDGILIKIGESIEFLNHSNGLSDKSNQRESFLQHNPFLK